jgi:hypothetical protein
MESNYCHRAKERGMMQIAGARNRMNSMQQLRPRRPANNRLNSNDPLLGAIFPKCGRQSAHELQSAFATAEPGHSRHELQSGNAGLTLHIECGRQFDDELQASSATAEPGQRNIELQGDHAGLTFSECGRQAREALEIRIEKERARRT